MSPRNHPDRERRRFKLDMKKESPFYAIFVITLLFLAVRFAMIETQMKIIHIPFVDDFIYTAIREAKFIMWQLGFANNPP